jgi:hypothetical protein
MTSILMLDAAGTPQEWIPPKQAALYVSAQMVAWSLGDTCKVMRGGHNAATGVMSTLELPPIIAVKGAVHASRSFRPLACERDRLFKRDRNLCAYCGIVYRDSELEAEHVIPESRGGPWSWTNLVSACRGCNARKDCRTPEEAKMPLLYVPYTPNRHETFILSGRNILADQMSYLKAGVSADSRLRQ